MICGEPEFYLCCVCCNRVVDNVGNGRLELIPGVTQSNNDTLRIWWKFEFFNFHRSFPLSLSSLITRQAVPSFSTLLASDAASLLRR